MPREDWPETTPEKIFGSTFPHGEIKTVLDVGCGLSVKSQYIECDWITALDIHWPYLRQARWQAIRKNITYVHANAMSIDDLFLPESFDLVLLQDVIEHFEKEDGWKLLTMAMRLAKKAMFVSTPLGFFPQNIDTWELGGDEWQTHRSAWYPGDFEKIGFYVKVRSYEPAQVSRHTDPAMTQYGEIRMIDAMWIKH